MAQPRYRDIHGNGPSSYRTTGVRDAAPRSRTGGEFSSGLSRELGALARLYDDAAALLETISGGWAGAAPVRCWPHHFDIATLLEVAHDADGSATKTIGVGLAPATPPYAT
jgi:hypothetical protein